MTHRLGPECDMEVVVDAGHVLQWQDLEKTNKNEFIMKKTYFLSPNNAFDALFGLLRCWGIVWGVDDVSILVGGGRSAGKGLIFKNIKKMV